MEQKLLFTTLELEKLKAEAMEEMKKNKEYVKQLINLLKFAIQERDEARNQLHKLLDKTALATTEIFPAIPHFQVESPLLKPGKANSSITESNSLSETYNYHSHGSSPVDSLFDAVSSPEFSNINLVVNQPLVQPDQGSVVIDSLAKGRTLPEKGKFLQTVMEAGPLLQTLLVAGPLPRWRNPPRLQPFQIPPVSMINGCDAEVFAQKPSSVAFGQSSYGQISCGPSSQSQSASFANLGSGNCVGNGSMMSSSGVVNNGCVPPFVKRQRFY